MSDNRESTFLDYNTREIFKQLIALEEHSRNLTQKNYDNSEVSCIFKHIASLSGHLDEAVSHSAEVAPEKTPIFQELSSDTHSLEKIVEQTKNPLIIIPRIREIRKKVEKLDNRYNTSRCRVCEVGHGSFLNENVNYNILEENPRDRMEYGDIISGIAGGALLAKTVDYAAKNVAMVSEHRTGSNVVIGLGALFAGGYIKPTGKIKKYLKTALTYGGVFLLTQEVVKAITSYTQPAYGFSPRLAVRPAAPMVQSVIRTGHLV